MSSSSSQVSPSISQQQNPACDSPAEHHNEVHNVPAVPQVGALVEHEAQRQQLDARLEAEDPNEVGLRLLLWIGMRPITLVDDNMTTTIIITSTLSTTSILLLS